MADPFDKLTRSQGGNPDLVTEFDLPTAPSGGPPVLGGLGIGSKPTSIRVRVLKNGDIQYWSVVEGQEPKRVVPTDDERAMVEQVIKSRREAAGPVPDRPPAQTPDQARVTAAQATTAEAAARTAANPPTITRPLDKPRVVGPEGQETLTESVTQAQAEYDLKDRAERRALEQQMIDAANQDFERSRQTLRDAVAAGTLKAQEARDKLTEEHNRIQEDLERSAQALTARGQDIQVRNADLTAGVSQRNADLGYEQGLAQQSTSLATASLPYMNAPGQIASTNSLMAGGPPVPTRPMAPPFDPLTFPSQAAQQARSVMPGSFTLPGGAPPLPPGVQQPPPLPPPQFRLPG
jgi:hypothetical protein